MFDPERLDAQEEIMYHAIKDGVEEAFINTFRQATSMSGSDMFEMVKQGVKEAFYCIDTDEAIKEGTVEALKK